MVTASSLSPGEEGSLDVTFDGRKRSGHQEKTVRVTTNDPENELLVLTIRAFVRTAISVEPETARVGAIGFNEERVVNMKLYIEDPEGVSVSRIKSSAPGVSGRIVDGSGGNGERILEVRFASGQVAGKFEETITLHTTSPDKPRLDIKVIGRVLGDIRLEPEAVGFRPVRGKSPRAKPIWVTVRNVGSTPFHITGVEDSTGYLRTEIEETDPGVSYRISVDIANDGPQPVPDSFNGLLRIQTDHPSQPVLELPVYRSGRMTGR